MKMKIEYDAIREKMQGKPYNMSLVGNDAAAVQSAVNQGIDSHLEACFCPERGDSYQHDGHHLKCRVSVESMPVLLRRLAAMENTELLVSDILDTLNIDVDGVDEFEVFLTES